MTKRRYFIIRWFAPLLGAAVVAGLFLYWQWPARSHMSVARTASDIPATAKHPSSSEIVELYSQSSLQRDNSAQPLSSADFVELRVSREGRDIKIALNIKKHWHINANPASLDSLIPTTVEVSANGSPVPARLNYPAGHAIDIGLAKPIRVYSGRLRLTAELAERTDRDPLQVQASVQACKDSGICLPPSILSAPAITAGID